MNSISVVISAYNEEAKLPGCLRSVSWADEIIVVDNESTDGTAGVAKRAGAAVYRCKNNPMLNVNKNYGFNKASGDWILNLDADEEIPKELAREIRHAIAAPNNIMGFWIRRKNIIFGKWISHGLWWPDRQMRLFRRGRGAFPCKHVHEYIEVEGRTGELAHPFVHYNYDTISQFIRKMDAIYTENEVQRLIDSGHRLFWFDAIRFPLSDFAKIYFAQEAYKDGLHGLIISILQSFYSFVVFAKLWERKRFEERTITLSSVNKELNHAQKELMYWSLTSQLKNTPSRIQRLWVRILRWVVTRL